MCWTVSCAVFRLVVDPDLGFGLGGGAEGGGGGGEIGAGVVKTVYRFAGLVFLSGCGEVWRMRWPTAIGF